MSTRLVGPTTSTTSTIGSTAPQIGLTKALIRTARPRQWIKNGLVLAAPLAAEVLSERAVAARVTVAFVALCVAASGTYFVNDVTDIAADRVHPTKRLRPVAAGAISIRLALAVGIALLVSALAIAAMLGPAFVGVVALYIALTVAYSTWLKMVPVVDVAAVASGFLLRAIAGAVAAEVAVSASFLLVSSFAALFIVVGKRHGEQLALPRGAPPYRATLTAYTPEFTSQLVSASLTATLVSYAAWAFSLDVGEGGLPWVALSVLPFTVGMLRATQLVVRGDGADPEQMLFDPGLVLAGTAVGALLVAGLYLW
jgi:decaprenyl-phosphate phosphoribosyltransferase